MRDLERSVEADSITRCHGAYTAEAPAVSLIALMMLVVLMRDRILLDSQHPIWKHSEPFKWWLAPHGIAAALTLLMGPLQFSSRLRRRHLNWHRISGRLYVAGVTVGVPLGIVIETIKYRLG